MQQTPLIVYVILPPSFNVCHLHKVQNTNVVLGRLCCLNTEDALFSQGVLLHGCRWLHLLLECTNSRGNELLHSTIEHLACSNKIKVLLFENPQLWPSILLELLLYPCHYLLQQIWWIGRVTLLVHFHDELHCCDLWH